jgi:membrane-associated phospholipid phosphatase
VLGCLFLLAYVVLAIGLVGMDYHYFTDTVGGFLVALGVTLPLTVLTDRLSARRELTGHGTAQAADDTPSGVSPR